LRLPAAFGIVIDLEIRVFQRYRRLPDIADRVVRWSTACDRLGGRPVVAWHGWSADGRFVLFMKAGNGDENYNLFVVEPNNGEVRNLSAFCGDHNAPGCGPLGGAPGAIRRVDSVTPSFIPPLNPKKVARSRPLPALRACLGQRTLGASLRIASL
jgi:hypothetical protein